MAAKPLPDQALLLKLLRYEPDTGKLFWRERTYLDFLNAPHPEHQAQAFNRTFAGKEAFGSIDDCGYKQGWVAGRRTRAHRVIWKMQTGYEPEQIDHANGAPGDNRWANLRAVSTAGNMQNVRLHDRNKSGCTGVFWSRQFNRWQAFISVGGKKRHLGLHVSKEAAICARKAAERQYGYHPNHGRKKAAN